MVVGLLMVVASPTINNIVESKMRKRSFVVDKHRSEANQKGTKLIIVLLLLNSNR